MKLTFIKRDIPRAAVAIAVALVAAAGMVAGREKPAIELVEARSAHRETAAAAPEIDLAKLKRGQAEAPHGDPFAPRSFAPPVQRAAAAAAAPEAPSAPPLPFSYLGRITQDGKTEVFVLRGEDLIGIAAGRKIDDQYRVDAISESSISFTYLPLKMQQSLELGEAGG
jgi:hypothetical protein